MHDSHGEKDEHLGLGQGSLPAEDICHALLEHAPDAVWAIEADGDGVRQTLIWLRQHGFVEQEVIL